MAIRSALLFRHQTKLFLSVCLISEYASVTINVYLYSIHLDICNATAAFKVPFKSVKIKITMRVLTDALGLAPWVEDVSGFL